MKGYGPDGGTPRVAGVTTFLRLPHVTQFAGVDVAVVGLPDPRTGERACAVIVPKKPPGPQVASLRAFLDAQGVATFKVPEQVVIWDALPKNDAGKVLKHQIRAALAQKG